MALAAETQGLVAPECPKEREESGLEEGFSELWEQGKQQTQEVGRAGWVLGRQACRREGGQELAVGGNQLGRVEKALDLGCALKVPGPHFEGNPVAEGTTRRGTATPVHRHD